MLVCQGAMVCHSCQVMVGAVAWSMSWNTCTCAPSLFCDRDTHSNFATALSTPLGVHTLFMIMSCRNLLAELEQAPVQGF